jgi:uncharacterized protein (TIGR03435 family)
MRVRFNRRRITLLASAGALALAAPIVIGQSKTVPVAAPSLTFEVASIKLNKSDSREINLGFGSKGNRFTASNIPVKSLIRYAYGINDDQILAAPAWLSSDHYDIQAEIAEADADWLHKLSPEQQMLLIKPLLEDRFKLQVHPEAKLMPAYELVVGRNGSKMKQAILGDTYPNGFKTPEGISRPGTFSLTAGQQDQLIFQALPVAKLARILSEQLEVPVMDKTGLAGNYDFTLRWAPDENPGAGPSIFTAVQEQLGLRLESEKLPVECLVIDHIERPSPN